MCKPVSFFKRLFGNVCYKSKYDELEEQFDKYKRERTLLIDGLNYDNEKLLNTLTKTQEDLQLAIDKLIHYNDLVEEHNSLRATYNQLKLKFSERVTVVKPTTAKTIENNQTDKTKLELILKMKYTYKQSYSRIAKKVNLTEDQIKIIIKEHNLSKKTV